MRDSNNRSRWTPLAWLCAIAALMCLVLAGINLIWLYPTHVGLPRQPTVCVVALYGLASVIWLWSLRTAVQVDTGTKESRRRLLWMIISFGICFRAIQICVPPILELDLYRYMWDGIVLNNGISPYAWSPAEVLTRDIVIDDADLRQLVEVSTKTPAHHAIVSQVHFAEYTTIYPPVSQLVFAAAMWCVPDASNVVVHLTVMKLTLILFDVATILLVMGLLLRAKMPVGWLVAYAWNPLVIKEIANSGHLDSIAVCFTTAAALVLVGWSEGELAKSRSRANWSAVLLAMGTAAKLFPVIMVPLFAFVVGRYRWQRAVEFGVVYGVATVILMSGMLLENDVLQQKLGLADSRDVVPAVQSKEGLTGFLTHWRMNDLVFSFVFENTKPDGPSATNRAWYVVTSHDWRQQIDEYARRNSWSSLPPFFYARLVTGGAFIVIYGLLLIRLGRRLPTSDAPVVEFLETIFLVVAAFFVMQPTQNPWYWVWAMPFVCFASNRGWLAVSLILFMYYLRFWFKFSGFEFDFMGFHYEKAGIFDHCVAWIEHLAILLAVLIGAVVKNRAGSGTGVTDHVGANTTIGVG